MNKTRMTNRIIIFLLLFLSLNLSAQDNPWYFSLNMGKSWPLGTFSQSSPGQLNKGFAQNGFTLSLESNYSLSDNFSFKSTVLLNTNSLNRLPLWTNLNNRLNSTIGTNTVIDQQYISLTSNPWVTNSLLVGPVYTFIFKNMKWDLYASGGFVVIYLPQAQLIYQNPTNNWIYIDRNINPRNFNYGVSTGTSLRFPISEKFDFRIGVNYFYSEASQTFEQVKITKTQTSTVTQQLNVTKATVPINIISATAGLVYYLK